MLKFFLILSLQKVVRQLLAAVTYSFDPTDLTLQFILAKSNINQAKITPKIYVFIIIIIK